MRSDDLVRHPPSDGSEYLDLAIAEIVLGVVLGQVGGDSMWNVSPSAVHRPDGLQQLGPDHVLQEVTGDSGLQRSTRQRITLICGQDDNSGLWVSASDRGDSIDAVDVRHLEIHQRDVRSLLTEHFDGFPAVRRFAYDHHVLLALDD